MAEYEHLTGNNGAHNMGGYKQTAFIAPLSEFLLIKEFKTGVAIVAEGDELTIDGSHTFTAPAGFTKIKTTPKTLKMLAECIGDSDGRSFKITPEFVYVGSKKQAASFAAKAKNDVFIIIVVDHDGTMYQIGTADLGAEIVGGFDSGTVSEGRKAWTFKAEAYANGLAFYEGAITEKA
jgi:hypothetical protein